MDNHILELAIPIYKIHKSHTVYIINIITNYPPFSIPSNTISSTNYFSINKRYSQFYNLHYSIKKYLPTNLQFPSKKLFGNLNEKTIENRREILENYLKYVCNYIIINKLENEKIGKILIKFITSYLF